MSLNSHINKSMRLLLTTGLTLTTFFNVTIANATEHHVNDEAEFNTAITILNDDDTIILDDNIVLSGALNSISRENIFIDGNNKTIDAQGNFSLRTYSINGIKDITVNNATQIHGNGGAISIMDSVFNTIDNSHFTNNSSGHSGGAVFVGQELDGGITNSTFTNNTSTSGGALYVNNSINGAGIESSIFTNNTASSLGGAVYVGNNIPLINSSQFINNTSGHYGGAIFTTEIGTITNSLFQGNTAEFGPGGAIYSNDAISFIDNSQFINNSTNFDNGGAIHTGNLSNISNSLFENNFADRDGGAIYTTGNVNGTFDNVIFKGNSSNGTGGAIYAQGNNFRLTVSAGNTTTFIDNTDATGTNSITTGMSDLNFTAHGDLYLYDPVRSISHMDFNKDGAGLLVLGGRNSGNNNWNIYDGRFRLTYDSQGNAASIENATDFTMHAGSTLEIVPDISNGNSNPATITTSNTIDLNGNTTVGSDYRFIERINILGEQTLLTLNSATINYNDTVTNTEGSFTLGQYDYEYDNLRWDGDNLVFNVKAQRVNAERNGAYSANADYRSRLANKTSYLIFEHFRKPFGYMKANQSQQYLAPVEKPTENLWGSAFYSKTNYSAHDGESSANGNISGLILGQDFNVTDNSFNGVAVSVAWPNYEQGTLDSSGKDIRLNFYGGKLLKDNWELGYIATAGFGDMSHERLAGNVKTNGKKDVKTYALGFNIAKDFYQDQDTTLRPFFSYEYIKTNSDGYTESDPLVGITASGHREDTSRVRLGLNYIKRSKNNSSFVGTVFYQGLYGDRNTNISSHMTSNPNGMINLSGSSVDKHALGLGLGWNKRFNEKLNLNLSYNALFSANANDHQIKAELNFKF